MELRAKLESLTSEKTVSELNEMLKYAHVTISNWGQRLVSVDGYGGTVEIDEIALKYLEAAPFERDRKTSLRNRLSCEALWGRVNRLYADSEAKLAKTSLYKYLVPIKEFAFYWPAYAGEPRAILGEREFGSTKDRLFEFTPDEFKKLWPDEEPEGKSWILGGGDPSERWIASKEMVESALND